MRLVLVLALAGCFGKPGFSQRDAPEQGDDAPSDGTMFDMPMVTFTPTGTGLGMGGTVSGPFFTLHFADGASTFHFPDHLLIDGTEHLGSDQTANCYAENQAGMALFPAHTIRSGGMAVVNTSIFLSPLEGPAVVKVTVNWRTDLVGTDTGGAALTRHPLGSSMFTVFPDGRIVRSDSMSDNGAGSTTPIATSSIDCQGLGTTSYFPTSFFTLADLPGGETLLGENGQPAAIPAGTDLSGNQAVCLDYGTQGVAFGWANALVSRVRQPTPNLYAFVLDFIQSHNVASIGSFNYTGRTEMFLGHGLGSCVQSGLLGRARLVGTAAPALQFNSDFINPGEEGIYGSEAAPVNVASTVTLHGAVTTTFAVWIRFADPMSDITVTKADTAGPFFVKQRVIGKPREWVVWFRDPLTPSQAITIAGQP
ncbi:MAG: hypothetical protein IPQ07_28750 [Myxococcales bacterium]|nr:hypothetical protein [Myxococcales bacterium]